MAGRTHVKRYICVIFLVLLCLSYVIAWDNEDLEVFDAVEEVNENFYELLGVDQTATAGDIRRAYRRLSLTLHPDRNKEDDAEIKFRQLVSVYEILKDEEKRKKYDEVLVNGLPDWRMPVYYYRKVRKMGLAEMTVLLLVIFTIGQFLVSWAVYLEKKFEVEEVLTSRFKKEKRGKKARLKAESELDAVDQMIQEELESIPRPKLQDLFILRFPVVCVKTVIASPQLVCLIKEKWEERQAMERAKEKEREEEEEMKAAEPTRKPKKRQKIELPEYTAPETDTVPVVYGVNSTGEDKTEEKKNSNLKTGEWTADDLSILAKAVSKFPSGTQERWEKIAEFVGRSTPDVISKAKQLNTQSLAGSALVDDSSVIGSRKHAVISDTTISRRQEADDGVSAETNKVRRRNKQTKSSERTLLISEVEPSQKTKNETEKENLKSDQNVPTQAGDGSQKESVQFWSQTQQKVLEWALAQYPRGTAERWEKIAEHVPDKDKDDCVARVKYISDMIKKKKQAAS
ncbi:dnaJ homolog subfamily C member 1 [Lingula anatina]|uniref:DnaJ homolog subfamily C member 1 n=1 Tax=Lingula anatina TaxID=7574 RepID=A0A1S3IHN7_LINAN|nr:dnaJ homolog subfamily C member 1 [Lingula anatina]|eukprot:XP_013397633.1 dnaJ homolog subfamily C member 1 [Lingula anatina]